jgi:ArsR family transcriptional regulator
MTDNQTENTDVTIKAAEILKALAHPVRLEILANIGSEGAYVMDLYSWLGRPQANISQHLAILRAADLVIAEREGMTVKYYLKSEKILELLTEVRKLAQNSEVYVTMRRGWMFGGRGRNFHHGRFRGGKGRVDFEE